jgi:hypothetical protein
LGISEYAGGAQAMRPYPRNLWGILGLANAKTSISSSSIAELHQKLEHRVIAIIFVPRFLLFLMMSLLAEIF